ncbi:rCG23576 [Rattus norvegicus]|uniref:RCG23576 n=1 Tax=Rattus norvegicus TaxID=10116 RepID=A6KHE2_RAT|nr:rCG23576 [Rattus norvegicus]
MGKFMKSGNMMLAGRCSRCNTIIENMEERHLRLS